MRVIFLDIDGVLNSESYLLKLEAKHHQLGHTAPAGPESASSCDCFKLYQQVDPDAIARLNRLVAVTDARIVVSSTWRKLFDPPELLDMLLGHGLVAEIIGETPDGHAEPEMMDVYGPLERVYRGYEIDFWLRKHPEVERFVILDDGSDMEMHKNRLVQTDCEEGLLDEHVELAIRVLAWDGETRSSPIERVPAVEPGQLIGADGARRAFASLGSYMDRLREAFPVLDREETATETATETARVEGTEALTGASWCMHCNEKGCVETLTLSCTTAAVMSDEESYEQLCPAHATAAVFLGWRAYRCVWWCPTHVVVKNLACARCQSACPACSCLGGPRGDAVDGIVVEATEGET